jgi:SnoaL-like domain
MKIPNPIAAFIDATNQHNTEALLATLAETAVINDEGQDYRGIAEIKKWSDEKVIGTKVTLEPIKTVEQSGKTIVTAKVDGTFDKTGLPDPLVLDFHFTIDSDKVAGLSIHLANS